MKKKACEDVGIASFGTDLPETVTQKQLLNVVKKYNADPNVHGILVQLPVRVWRPFKCLSQSVLRCTSRLG